MLRESNEDRRGLQTGADSSKEPRLCPRAPISTFLPITLRPFLTALTTLVVEERMSTHERNDILTQSRLLSVCSLRSAQVT